MIRTRLRPEDFTLSEFLKFNFGVLLDVVFLNVCTLINHKHLVSGIHDTPANIRIRTVSHLVIILQLRLTPRSEREKQRAGVGGNISNAK